MHLVRAGRRQSPVCDALPVPADQEGPVRADPVAAAPVAGLWQLPEG